MGDFLQADVSHRVSYRCQAEPHAWSGTYSYLKRFVVEINTTVTKAAKVQHGGGIKST
jgi:hypothetical protein